VNITTAARRAVAIGAIVALGLIPASLAGATTHHKAKAKVHTVTKIVYRTVDVNVPGPATNTTPASCTAAITLYRTLGSGLASLATDYVQLIGPAAEAGASNDAAGLDNIVSEEQGYNSQLSGMVSQDSEANQDAAACEG
jgi:hypothetical protein